jgi:fatty-acyl-CoA synthase
VFGFTQALAALAGGAPMRMLPLFDAAEAARALRDEAITHANGGDDMLDRLLVARDEPQPFPALRFFGFARFNPALDDLVERAGQRGVRACGLYGMSEVHALFSLQPPELPAHERAKGGGVLVSAEADVRICDPDSCAVLPAGEQGEIELKGPSLMREYYGDPQATREAFHDGWFRTGDLGYLDGVRRFCYVARIGDVLRLGGFLTSPQEIEAVLESHPAVQGAQVVGANFGREPGAVAFVVAAPDARIDEATLQAWCKARLAGYKVPRRFVPIDAFPTTPSANGTKIQRARLRAMAAEIAALG